MALGAAAAMGIPVAAFAEENEKKPYASGYVAKDVFYHGLIRV